MKRVSLTAFCSPAEGLLTPVEEGETLLVIRHGRSIAEIRLVEYENGL